MTRINDVLNDNNRHAFGAILTNLDTTTTAIARRSGDIEGALHNANATMDNLRVATSTLTPTIHDADLTIRKLGKVADDADAFVNGDGLAPDFRPGEGIAAPDRQPHQVLRPTQPRADQASVRRPAQGI